MKTIHLGLAAALALTLASCSDPVEPFENPTSQNMQFKTGASYISQTTVTNPEDSSETKTERHWTLVNPSTTLHGRANVAVWIDSVFTVGAGAFNFADSILLQQLPGNNDVYRYAQLIPELTVPITFGIDLSQGWKQEVKLNAQSSSWFVAEIADTIPAAALGIPDVGVTGVKIAITDRAQAAGTEAVMIGSTSYTTSKTIHTIEVSASALTVIGVPVKIVSESLTRTTWTSADLGAIIKEEREGKVIQGTYNGQTYKLFPIPGYKSSVTTIVSTGN